VWQFFFRSITKIVTKIILFPKLGLLWATILPFAPIAKEKYCTYDVKHIVDYPTFTPKIWWRFSPHSKKPKKSPANHFSQKTSHKFVPLNKNYYLY
jgi:hypothetical protein